MYQTTEQRVKVLERLVAELADAILRQQYGKDLHNIPVLEEMASNDLIAAVTKL